MKVIKRVYEAVVEPAVKIDGVPAHMPRHHWAWRVTEQCIFETAVAPAAVAPDGVVEGMRSTVKRGVAITADEAKAAADDALTAAIADGRWLEQQPRKRRAVVRP